MNIFSYKKKRFLFVSRIKFAKRYSIDFFDKEYNKLDKMERFYLTYFIFCKDIIKAYTEFQTESNYQVFKKMTIDELNDNEIKLIDIDDKKKKKYNELLNIYHKTPYYSKKEEDRKEFDKQPISTTIGAHGHYANLSSIKVYGFYKYIKEEYKKMNKEIYDEKFEYYYNENSSINYNEFRKNDIKNTKFIFDQLNEYYFNLKTKDNYHANELYESTYDNYIHFSDNYSKLTNYDPRVDDLI